MLTGILGHGNLSLTMNTHARVMSGMLRDAANLMDSVLTMQRQRFIAGLLSKSLKYL
jgi:hypothetical protein